MIKWVISIFVFLLIFPVAYAQSHINNLKEPPKIRNSKVDSVKPVLSKSLTITAEIRNRTEFRHGYKNFYPVNDDTTAAFFNTQRTRLNFTYSQEKFDLYASLQDVRVWGQMDPRQGQNAPLYLFEIYAEPHFNDKWSVRIGRQRLLYDNERLFSENDWRNTSNSHDAAKLIFNDNKNFKTDFTAAYNQSAENILNSDYKPVGFQNYKVLLVHYLNVKMKHDFTLTTMNVADGYQSSRNYKTTNMRFTSGGRIEYSGKKLYGTISAYYQYGKDSSSKNLSAWYAQPEVRLTSKSFTIRLGAEIMSGTDAANTNTDNSFVPLYGTAHTFNGNLDLLSAFPKDVGNAGLINPYLFFEWAKDKWTVKMQNHLFYSLKFYVHSATGLSLKKYLGFENDYRIYFKANNFTTMEFGGGWALAENSFIEIKNPKTTKPENYSSTPYFAYFSIKFNPTILKMSF